MNNIFKKFGDSIKQILVIAEQNSAEQKSFLNTEHQLAAITQFKDCLANEVLAGFNVTADRVQLISALLVKNKNYSTTEKITADAKKAIQLSVQIAAEYGHTSIEPEHLLLALISDKSFNSFLIIERIGANPDIIRAKIESIFKGLNKKISDVQKNVIEEPMEQPLLDEQEEGFDFINPLSPGIGLPLGRQNHNKGESVLDLFTTNLTKKARENNLDPVIGRQIELNRIVQTLSRRTKNNPILIGEPGVGKTSIVDGLAQRIVQGKVPAKLANTEILAIDIGSILAGTMYRGQFESRIKKMLAEIKKRGNIILFADEIHMLIGAGSTEGSVDAANLLKPMLSRGELRMIGSTTFDEYKKHIEKDPAFERRFQPLTVVEPSIDETVAILRGIKTKYEEFHNISYSDDALIAAANFSKRFINDRFLPDKAVDLIDEAGASTHKTSVESLRLNFLKNKLKEILAKKERLIETEQYEEATKLRLREIKIENEIKLFSSKVIKKSTLTITEEDIAKIISDWTHIPVSNLTTAEKKKYLRIDRELKKHVIGQDQAVDEIAKALKRRRVGISNQNKPIGSFIFLGPTGVGKTELARVMAREIYGQESALVKIDMSEFMERHNISRLVGSPAGYVGYEEGGKLTEIVRKNPYSIILFDEIEKAHPEVFNILLQIMDEGLLTDAKGRKIDFKNTILILTSNLGTDIIRKQTSIGFNNNNDTKVKYDKLKESILENVEKTFKPEFINRLDKIVVFYQLNEKDIRKIVDLQIEELKKRLVLKQYGFEIDEAALELVAKKSYSPEFGARPVKKFIADNIELPISEKILKDSYLPGETIKVTAKNSKLHFS